MREWLQGKKTIIGLVLMAFVLSFQELGWINEDVYEGLMTGIGLLTGGALAVKGNRIIKAIYKVTESKPNDPQYLGIEVTRATEKEE
jgi:hypothetical protein